MTCHPPVATIDRTGMSLPPLQIGPEPLPVAYEDPFVWDGDLWDRQVSSSPWVHGGVLVAAVRQVSAVRVSAFVQGADAAQIRVRFEEVRDAVSQFRYTLTLSVDAATYVYTAQPADISLGFTRSHVLSFGAPLTLDFPVSPIGG